MHFDGSKIRTGLGAGIVLTSPKGDKLKYTLQIHFASSNNMAEYEALIHRLRLGKEIGIRRIQCYGNSDLVVQQSSGEWDAKDANMASYHFLIQQISGHFDGCEFIHVPRADNEAADALAKIGSTRQAIPAGVSLECLRKPSIKPSPKLESIFVPADPRAAESGSGAAAAESGPGTSARGSGVAAAVPGPGASAPGPGTSAAGPRTSTAEQRAAGSSPPPPTRPP
jgi:ribonuclease HI